jgi:hypothetical protein
VSVGSWRLWVWIFFTMRSVIHVMPDDMCDAPDIDYFRRQRISIFPSVRVHYFTIASNTETDKEFLLAFSIEVRIYRYKYI